MAKHQIYVESENLEYLIDLVKAQDDSDEKILLLADLIRAKQRPAGVKKSD